MNPQVPLGQAVGGRMNLGNAVQQFQANRNRTGLPVNVAAPKPRPAIGQALKAKIVKAKPIV